MIYILMQTVFATSVEGLRWMIKVRQAWLRAMWQSISWLEHNSELNPDVDVVGNTKIAVSIKRTVEVYLKVVGAASTPLIYTSKSSSMVLLIGTIINLKNTVISAPEYYEYNGWRWLTSINVPHDDYRSSTLRLSKNKILGLEPPTSLYNIIPTQIGSFI